MCWCGWYLLLISSDLIRLGKCLLENPHPDSKAAFVLPQNSYLSVEDFNGSAMLTSALEMHKD